MNQFPTEYDDDGKPCPILSAKSNCDKHVVKIITEIQQMATCACIRHGATPDMLPLSKAGTPLRGGYPHHPMTIWVGDTKKNFLWTLYHGAALCEEFTKRYGKEHFVEHQLEQLFELLYLIPDGDLTEMPQCMPDKYKVKGDVVKAYRLYYAFEKSEIAKWEKGRPSPKWYDYYRGVISGTIQ